MKLSLHSRLYSLNSCKWYMPYFKVVLIKDFLVLTALLSSKLEGCFVIKAVTISLISNS